MRASPVAYRWQPTPLHACRATVAAGFGGAFALAALIAVHPLILFGLLIAVCAAAAAARVGGQLARVAVWTVPPLVIVTVLVNVLVTRDGITVFARLGDWGVLGQVNLTVEAAVYGALSALRLVVVVLAGTLAFCVADPDELLAASRRLLPRSGLAAVLGTRMLPVLAADARRLSDAQRCRPGGAERGPRARLAIIRATVEGALDRSLDVAAVLEMRGYGGVRSRVPRPPRSRHDIAFSLAGLAVVALAIASLSLPSAAFHPYPLLYAAFGVPLLLLVLATVLAALLPFADRRGIER